MALEGADVVVRGPGGVRRARLTTLADAGEAVGLQPGFPWTKHRPGTEYEPHADLFVDPEAAAALAGWFALGQEALVALAAEAPAEQPSTPQIFPEHFDLGITAGAVNYGFSPGDDAIPTPYVYVSPHEALTDNPFWNVPFGAYRTWGEVPTLEEALRFSRAAERWSGCYGGRPAASVFPTAAAVAAMKGLQASRPGDRRQLRHRPGDRDTARRGGRRRRDQLRGPPGGCRGDQGRHRARHEHVHEADGAAGHPADPRRG